MIKLLISLCVIIIYSSHIVATPFFKNIVYDITKNPYSLQAISMGNAFTAVANGADSSTTNPAGIAIPGRLFSVQEYDINQDIFKDYKSQFLYISPLTFSKINQNRKTGESISMTIIGYGKKGSRGVDWGINYKSITGNNPDRISGWSSDLGLLARFSPQVNFGIIARDIFKKDIDVPTTFQFGVALFTQKKSFTLSTDFVQHKENKKSSLYGYHGFEWLVSDELKIRGGYFQENITTGVKLSINILIFKFLEYATVTDYNTDESIYMFSINTGKGLIQTSSY